METRGGQCKGVAIEYRDFVATLVREEHEN